MSDTDDILIDRIRAGIREVLASNPRFFLPSMSNDTEITPALTPEEWAKVNTGEYDAYDMLVRWDDDDLPTIMALANHDIADTDPRKITRAHVEACRAFDFHFGQGGEAISASVEVSRADCEALQRLAAALSAILPP